MIKKACPPRLPCYGKKRSMSTSSDAINGIRSPPAAARNNVSSKNNTRRTPGGAASSATSSRRPKQLELAAQQGAGSGGGRGSHANNSNSIWDSSSWSSYGRELEEAFEFFDTDGDGRISAGELAAALRRLGDEATDEEVAAMMREADSDGDGFVSREEFMRIHGVSSSSSSSSAASWSSACSRSYSVELLQAFRLFDADHNGFISAPELQRVVSRLGLSPHPSLDDCARMIARVDLDHDGQVSFEEFKSMMMPHPLK